MEGLLLGLLLLATTFAVKLHPQLHIAVTWTFALIAASLITLGLTAPSAWVGTFLIWVGLQIPWTQLVFKWRKIDVAPLFNIISVQGATIMGGLLYILLAHSGRAPGALKTLAIVAILWAVFNSLCAGYSASKGGLPGRFVDIPGHPESAYVGSNHMLSWLCGLGLLSGIYLASSVSPLWIIPLPLLGIGVLFAKNLTGLLSGAAGAVMFLALTWGPLAGLLLAVPVLIGAGCWAWTNVELGPPGDTWTHIRCKSLRVRWEGWKQAWPHVTWTGRGLGYYVSLRERTPLAGETIVWDHLHNEWLQGLLELGPLPIICALGWLFSRWLGLPSGPEAAYAYSLTVLTATQAIMYFPLHMPGQALPLLVGMAALDTAQ